MKTLKYILPLVTLLMLLVAATAFAGGGYEAAAWQAADNSKVPAVAGESLTGVGHITGPGNFLCVGVDDVFVDAWIGDTQLSAFPDLPVTGETAKVTLLVKPDGSPFNVDDELSVTVLNGSDEAGVGFTAYNCANVTVPDEAYNLIASYVAPAPAAVAEPAAPAAEPVTETVKLTTWAQMEPQMVQDARAAVVTGMFTVTVPGDYVMFGVDDAATSVTYNGDEMLANCVTGVKMRGEMLRTVVCEGPWYEGDVITVVSKDVKGGGSGVYAQSGLNRFSGTYQNWDAANAQLVVTDVKPDNMVATEEAVALAAPSQSRIDALEATLARLVEMVTGIIESQDTMNGRTEALLQRLEALETRLNQGQ